MRQCLIGVLLFAACGTETSAPDGEVASSRQPLTSVVLEQPVGSPLRSYVDPEFSATTLRVAYIDQNAVAWLTRIDPATGMFEGREQRLGQSASLAIVLNGPEFGNSQRGETVVWSGTGSNGFRQFFTHRDGVTRQLTSAPFDIVGNLPGKNGAAPDQRIIGSRMVAGERQWFWLTESAPNQLHDFPLVAFGSSGPRWYLDEDKILTTVHDASGRVQIALLSLDGSQTQLTADLDDKEDAFVFRAPEFDGAPVLVTTIAKRTLAFYRDLGAGSWSRVQTMTFNEDLRSAEPVVFAGKSGVTVARQTGPGRTVVQLVGLDGSVVDASLQTQKSRNDPESLVVGSTLFVYYFGPGRAGVVNLFVSTFVP